MTTSISTLFEKVSSTPDLRDYFIVLGIIMLQRASSEPLISCYIYGFYELSNFMSTLTVSRHLKFFELA